MNIKLFTGLILTFSINLNLNAQNTGKVDYKYLGISFQIPDGWIGQEAGEGYLVGSNTVSGFAYIIPHQEKSLEALKQQAQQGIQDNNGTALRLAGELKTSGSNAIAAEFSGTLEWQPVKAYLIGMVNPHGQGITIMAAASPADYNQAHQDLAQQLAGSMSFYQPEQSQAVAEWRQTLNNAKLTYMDSYYSSGSSYGGYSTGGGYSDKVEIHLCSQGFFKYVSSSSMSIDTGGAFGNSSGSNQGDGTWEVAGNAGGEAVLQLKFMNGEVHEYTLTYENKGTYLNGKRYYRTYASEGADYAPDCW
ncbi:MAG: hypothetical protein ACNS62_07580 [Candidatus Cyclobacteriaceae bacterium M3_2C_046]